jgi:ATP-dependent Lon protease
MPDFQTTSADQSDALRPISIPQDAVPIVPVRNTVLFPGMPAPITLSAPSSVAAARKAVREQRQIGILLQQDPELGHPVVCQGVQWMRVLDFIPGTPFLTVVKRDRMACTEWAQSRMSSVSSGPVR